MPFTDVPAGRVALRLYALAAAYAPRGSFHPTGAALCRAHLSAKAAER